MALEARSVRPIEEALVISRTEEGFRVYAPADPTKSYLVTGSPERPACTCSDYQGHEGNPFWRCLHITAVLNQLDGPNGRQPDHYDAEERRAIQEEGQLPEPVKNGAGTQMLLKRSVSPDGKIDSLSVEFSCPVNDLTGGDIKGRAGSMLSLQGQIIGAFLNGNGGNSRPVAAGNNGNGSNGNGSNPDGTLPAQMQNIGGINTKWGRRLFIGIQSNGQSLKFFGSRKQLAEALSVAGYARLAERIDEGMALNVPCRIITRPSEDGRYVNVESVLPSAQSARRGM
jgi:hypothetical protein